VIGALAYATASPGVALAAGLCGARAWSIATTGSACTVCNTKARLYPEAAKVSVHIAAFILSSVAVA